MIAHIYIYFKIGYIYGGSVLHIEDRVFIHRNSVDIGIKPCVATVSFVLQATENISLHLITKVKQQQANSVLKWGTAWEYQLS